VPNANLFHSQPSAIVDMRGLRVHHSLGQQRRRLAAGLTLVPDRLDSAARSPLDIEVASPTLVGGRAKRAGCRDRGLAR
jgi:hypothetical protein